MRVPGPHCATISRVRERRFQKLVLDTPVATTALATFDAWLQSPEGPCEARVRRLKRDAMIRAIVDSVRAQLDKRGVPMGFHYQALVLQQRRAEAAAHEGRPPLACGHCSGPIDPMRDFACSLKLPVCKGCVVRECV